jgi:DNA-binding transcriptional LysR family regulator
MQRRVRDATLRQLQLLVAAARTLSFTRAAREVHLTQPAVSMQIRELERIAGLPLFDRSRGRLRLTAAGEALAVHARRILGELRDAEESLAALAGLSRGRLEIAVVSTAKYFAPRLLALFARRHPGIELRLLVNNRAETIRLLADDEVDLAITGTTPHELPLEARPFARHPLVIVAPPEHPLAGRRRVAPAELSGETFLVREPGSGTRAALERFLRGARVHPGRTAEMHSNETIKQAVMAGMGIAFLSGHAVVIELAAGHLIVLPVEGLPVHREWNVVHRAGKVLSPAAAAFRAFVLEEGSRFLARWPPAAAGPGPTAARP